MSPTLHGSKKRAKYLNINIGPGSQQLEGDVIAALLAGDGQGGHPLLVHGVHVGRVLEQEGHDGGIVAAHRHQQRGPRVHAAGVHL